MTTPASSNGQPSGFIEPAKFSTVVKKINDTDVELIFNAKIDEGWYLYSQFQESDDGPMPTAFTYDEGEHYELVGKAKESSNLKKVYDKVFGMDVNKFAHNATFTQRIKIKDTSKPVTGYFEFQTCDDAKCIASALDVFLDTKTMEAFVGKTATEKIATANGDDNSSTTASATDVPSAYPSELVSVNMDNPAKKCNDTEEEESTIWGIFLLGLLGGLVALLTPCVFPMIPLTVSFFTKSAGNKSKGIRDAVLYGAFIFAVYLILSIPFHVMDSVNPDILNDISTNVYLNIAFFVIFLFFAFSFFGYYELTLPQSWTNKASSAEGTGGILGIFFMALTLALVSFSCTGPILGSLLAGALSSDGGAWQLTAGMGGFGLALALPFALFAAFPKWMNALPQSGGWLTTVKVVLGFLELALALKFFSNADMVAHWGILRYELFMGIWVVIFIGLGLYLFGKIKFPHDSPIQKLSPIRMGLGALSFAFVLYLLTGFMQNKETGTFTSKSLLSGLAPPVCYCWTYPCDCPGNLDCFKDIQAGWAYAKKNKKPILLDFTGYACVNCRKMEEHVWPVKKVDKFLKNDYVLISLYVDDKKALPEEEQITVQKPKELGGGTRKLRTYGNKWSYLQTRYFKNNTQPLYVLMSPDGELLSAPVGYTPDATEYAAFLNCGLSAYHEKLQEENRLGLKQD
ncbi:MAG TPA: thioredoxin family protein [Phaeodactylibacter sp.]|nr:thioredoxin family protein [Phaeodactylibacter sp.]